MGHLGNSLPLYRKVLQSVMHDLPSHSIKLTQHFEQNQKLEAMRLIHTLKGPAAAVGVQSLAMAPLGLESQIKQSPQDGLPHESVRELLALMETEREHLRVVLGHLAKTDKSLHGTSEGTAIDAP